MPQSSSHHLLWTVCCLYLRELLFAGGDITPEREEAFRVLSLIWQLLPVIGYGRSVPGLSVSWVRSAAFRAAFSFEQCLKVRARTGPDRTTSARAKAATTGVGLRRSQANPCAVSVGKSGQVRSSSPAPSRQERRGRRSQKASQASKGARTA